MTTPCSPSSAPARATSSFGPTITDERHAQDDNFAKKYEQMHRLVKEPDNETTLYVGAENWPLPIPIVEP